MSTLTQLLLIINYSMNVYNPLNPSVVYSLHLTKKKYFNIKRGHQNISYVRRAYESVDVRSLFWVISHRSKESSTPGLKGI